MSRLTRFALPVLLAAQLAACAAPSGEFPSLAIRDAERVKVTAAPVDPVPAAPPAPELADPGDAGEWLERAQAAHREFQQALPAASSKITAGQGAAPGTDRWADAQIALAALQTARSRLNVAVAELDRLYVAALTSGQLPGAIETARSESVALLDNETAQIDSLSAGLR